MSDERDGPLEGIEDVYAEREPSGLLEERVVADWRAAVGPVRGFPWWLRAAAAIVFFAAGWGSARLATPEASPTAADVPGARGAAHMLLLWEGPDFDVSADPAGHAAEYGRWALDLIGRGLGMTGDELGPSRTMLSPEGAVAGPAGDYRVSGYFIVETGDPEQAREVALSHPHLRHGGFVEVVPIVQR